MAVQLMYITFNYISVSYNLTATPTNSFFFYLAIYTSLNLFQRCSSSSQKCVLIHLSLKLHQFSYAPSLFNYAFFEKNTSAVQISSREPSIFENIEIDVQITSCYLATNFTTKAEPARIKRWIGMTFLGSSTVHSVAPYTRYCAAVTKAIRVVSQQSTLHLLPDREVRHSWLKYTISTVWTCKETAIS